MDSTTSLPSLVFFHLFPFRKTNKTNEQHLALQRIPAAATEVWNAEPPMLPGAEPRVNVVARCAFSWRQTWCGSLLRMGHLLGPGVFPIRDHQHLFL